MTNAEYHAHSAISKSDLDLINRSPAHFKFAKEHPNEQTESLLLGSLVHKLVLEPSNFAEEYVTAPKCDKRTKEGKATWLEFLESSNGRTVITEEIRSKAEEISRAVANHSVAKLLLQNGKAEQSFFWTDSETGVECKCRPDFLRSDGLVIDVKTTADASVEAFVKSAYNYRYYVQAWWYLHGLRQCGIDAKDFIFIAVEKEPPYAVCVYAADDLMLQLGERESMKNLKTYAECLKSDIWYGYEKEPQIHSLSLPDWVIRKNF